VTARGLTVFKTVLYGLLILNVGTFLYLDPEPHRAIDQIGWLILLGVFEYETRLTARGGVPAVVRPLPLLCELAGYACALYALRHYVAAADGIEIANAATWLAISAMIWIDILWPTDTDTTAFRLRSVLKSLLYGMTLVCAGIWGWRGSLIDFYDSALWILCFFVIELNILRLEGLASRVALPRR
jgi:hypothetical protein